jgi:hypothetical protein
MLCEAPPDVFQQLFPHGYDRVVFEPGFPI